MKVKPHFVKWRKWWMCCHESSGMYVGVFGRTPKVALREYMSAVGRGGKLVAVKATARD